MRQVGTVSGQHRIIHETVAVISAEAIPCTEPKVSPAVLMHVAYRIMRQAVIRGIMLEHELKGLGLKVFTTGKPRKKHYK